MALTNEIITFLRDWGALTVAGISLLVAIISLIKSSKAQKLQYKINKLEYDLKQYEIDKMKAEKADANKACVEARIYNISKGNYKMKVWNSGDIVANNITVVVDEGTNLIMMGDMLPFEELAPGKSFDIPTVVHYGTARKFYVTTKWSDSDGNISEKRQMVSL